MSEVTYKVDVEGGGAIYCTSNPVDPWTAHVADRVVVTADTILARFDDDHIIQVYSIPDDEYTIFDFDTTFEVLLGEWYGWVKASV